MLTVMLGLVPASVRMLPVEPLLSKIQLPAEAVVVSPKIRFPIVRAESRRTVVSAARFRVLKLAVKPTPSAMVPPDQLVPALQRLPEVSWVHVPSAA